MKRLTTLFWKEWRDHRAALFALGIAAPALVLAAFLAFDDRLIQDTAKTEPSVLFLPFLVLMVVIAVGSEMFAGESRRETLGFLSRMPDGLGRPLLAKMLFYIAASLGAVLHGGAMLLLAHVMYGHAGEFWNALGSNYHDWQIYTLVAIGAGLWVTLVSCWVPRGGGAILGGALLLGFVALPLFLLHRMETYFIPTKDETIALGAFATVTALIALYMSFGIGRRHGRGVWSSAWRGLAVVGVLICGTTAFGVERVNDLRTLTIDEPDFRMHSATLLRGERWIMMYVGEANGPGRVWAVDLETGEHQQVGPRGATSFHANPIRNTRALRSSSQPSRLTAAWFVETVDGRRVSVNAWFDAEAGEVIKTIPWGVPSPEIDGIWEGEARERTLVRNPNGRRAWIGRPPKKERGRALLGYVVEGEDGKTERHALPGQLEGELRWGWMSSGNSRKVLYTVDPFAGRVRKVMPVGPKGRPLYGAFVAASSPGRVLVQSRGSLHWVNMDSGESTELDLPGVRSIGMPQLGSDGRIRARARKDGRPALLVVDPDAGKTQVLDYAYHTTSGPRFPDGRLFAHNYGENRTEIFDEKTGKATVLKNAESIWPLGEITGESFLARQGSKRIVRYYPATGKIENVWPR